MALQRINIEIDTRCNARCFYCDTGNKSRNPHRKTMDVDLFTRIIDHALATKLADKETVVYLFDRGEPTLHPEFSAIVRALNSRSLHYCISSNCGRTVDLDDDVSMAGLEQFVISVPGFSQESYDRIHRLPFPKVLSNIEKMLADFRQRGFRGETVMSFHTYRFNLDEFVPADEYCQKLDISFAPYYAFFADTVWGFDFAHDRLSPNIMARAEQELFLNKLREQISKAPSNYSCPQYDYLTINEIGDLVLCCGAPRQGDTYRDGYQLGRFLDLGREDVMRLKTTSNACAECLACGMAYMNHEVVRPSEYSPVPQNIESSVRPTQLPLMSQHANSWIGAENSILSMKKGRAVLQDDAGHGYHRVLGWVDGGEPGQVARLSFLARQLTCSKIKVELHDDGAATYATASFDLAHGHHYAQQGQIAEVSIERIDDGSNRILLAMAPTKSTRLHFAISLVRRNGAVIFTGDGGAAISLSDMNVIAG